MGRFTNGILITIGLAAVAALAIEGFADYDFLSAEATALMCVTAAVPLVIATIRAETRRHSEQMQAALTAGLTALGEQMERAAAHHAAQAQEQTVERVVEALARGQATAVMDKAQSRFWSDTGPFPIVRN
ncbi:hypothetical protein N5079_19545 [Planotetraspora sp. A-T 1434]|uniref:hypothetical protein n=1 Tax=Planotetraspora sp. A-T 1434 TaxID=2979219 RepID=UPI0021BF2FBA|nr:hypothetical protein [Planotetraspora sp. A-T 1434]MCT9932398.1 hypothetical protein [Planotetraspora sp. A-T 1434]